MFFLIILKIVFSRFIRLKHPVQNLYVGGLDFYPTFQVLDQSDIFYDEASEDKPGKILILVKNKDNRVWDIESSYINLIYYPRHNGKNQLFSVIHLARDVVAIESNLGGCLEFVENLNRFQLSSCQYDTNFANQTFLVTDEAGVWVGSGSMEAGWGTPAESAIKWGICAKCIPGGFGSESQGDLFDASKAAVAMDETKKLAAPIAAANEGVDQGNNPNSAIFEGAHTTGEPEFAAGSWYGAGGGGGGAPLSQPGKSYTNDSFSFSKGIDYLSKTAPSMGKLLNGVMNATGVQNTKTGLSESSNVADFINNFQNDGPKVNVNVPKVSVYDKRVNDFEPKVHVYGPKVSVNVPKVSFQVPKVNFYDEKENENDKDPEFASHFDSFGNKFNSVDHKLDQEFDNLTLKEKENLLQANRNKKVGNGNTIINMKRTGNFPGFFKNFVYDFSRSLF